MTLHARDRPSCQGDGANFMAIGGDAVWMYAV